MALLSYIPTASWHAKTKENKVKKNKLKFFFLPFCFELELSNTREMIVKTGKNKIKCYAHVQNITIWNRDSTKKKE